MRLAIDMRRAIELKRVPPFVAVPSWSTVMAVPGIGHDHGLVPD